MRILAYCGDNSLYILIFHLLCLRYLHIYIYLSQIQICKNKYDSEPTD